MSYATRGSSLPGIAAGADLTASRQRFVSIDATGRAVLTAVGARIDGALENNPDIDQAASIQGPGAVVKIEASAAIAEGAQVASAANGQGVTAVAGNYIAGVCVVPAGAVGELCSVFLTFPGRAA